VIPGLDSDAIEGLSVSLLADARGGRGLLARSIVAQAEHVTCVGWAYPFAFRAGDNLAFHVAIAHAPPGSVLVATCGSPTEHGVFGAILGEAARQAGIVGLVTDGYIRDRRQSADAGFPVFAAGRCARKSDKQDEGRQDAAVLFGPERVAPRDLVCADDDGVVVVPGDEVAATLESARRLPEQEAVVLGRIAAGETSLSALALGSVHLTQTRSR
jgi:4-hydroxy-4-methyl-2-oxoglutarate aldolase